MTIIDSKKREIYKIIGKNIQRARKQNGWSQEKFAEKMNVSWSYVSKIESGILNISIGKLIDFSKTLKTDLQDILKVAH